MTTPGPDRTLGPRLEAVLALVGRGARVADVGSDHGLLPAALLGRGVASWCVATERLGPRRRTRPPRAAAARACDGLEFRYGDGLSALRPSDRIDTLVLAGMGGDAVRRILSVPEFATLAIRRLVIQPQSRHAAVRAFLRGSGFALVAERLVVDGGRRYLVLAARPGTETAYDGVPGLSADDLLEAGPLLVRNRDPVALVEWSARRERHARIAARAPGGPDARAARELARAGRVVAALLGRTGAAL